MAGAMSQKVSSVKWTAQIALVLFLSIATTTYAEVEIKEVARFVKSKIAQDCPKSLQSPNCKRLRHVSVELQKESRQSLIQSLITMGTLPRRNVPDQKSLKPQNENVRNIDQEAAENFLSAYISLPRYQDFSILTLVACVEQNKEVWREDCHQSGIKSFVSTCLVSDGGGGMKYVPIEFDPSCNRILFRLNSGILNKKPNYKLVYELFEYKTWKSLVRAMYKFPLRDLEISARSLHMGTKANAENEILSRENEKEVRLKIESAGQTDPSKVEGLQRLEFADNNGFVEGKMDGNLFDMVEAGILRPEDVNQRAILKKIILQLTAGLANLHRMGYVHRDLKPENVLVSHVDDVDRVKAVYTDFGLTFKPAEVCKKGMIKLTSGTPPFIAPEVYMAGIYEDCTDITKREQKADVFSHASVLYELTHGYVPWTLENSDKTYFRTFQELLIFSFHKLIDHYPAVDDYLNTSRNSLAPLLLKALSWDPDKRPDMEEFETELKAVL